MTSIRMRIGMAAAFLLAVGGTAAAQKPAPGVRVEVQPGSGAAAAAQTFRAKDVLGSKVTITGNQSIGTVDDLIFDGAGNMEYLVVNDNGKLVTVPWEAAQFNATQRTAVVNITPEQFKTVPTYTPTTYPQFFTPEYRNQVYKYYNVTPRQLRRLERRGVAP